jgi:hypothetical protein
VPAATHASEAITANRGACVTTQGIADVESNGQHLATVSYVLVVTYHGTEPTDHDATPSVPPVAATVRGTLWRITGNLWVASDGRPLVLHLGDGRSLPCVVTRGRHPESAAHVEAASVVLAGGSNAWATGQQH